MSAPAGANGHVIPEDYIDLLDSTALANVATIGPYGEPHVSPVWFGWDGTNIRFSQTSSAQKQKNLQNDPRISISLVDPTDEYRYLEIRGRVISIEPDPDYTFLDEMAKKYLNEDVYPYKTQSSTLVIIVVEPIRTTQWAQTPRR